MDKWGCGKFNLEYLCIAYLWKNTLDTSLQICWQLQRVLINTILWIEGYNRINNNFTLHPKGESTFDYLHLFNHHKSYGILPWYMVGHVSKWNMWDWYYHLHPIGHVVSKLVRNILFPNISHYLLGSCATKFCDWLRSLESVHHRKVVLGVRERDTHSCYSSSSLSGRGFHPLKMWEPNKISLPAWQSTWIHCVPLWVFSATKTLQFKKITVPYSG